MSQTYVIFFTSSGYPKTGLTPTITTYINIADGSSPGAAPSVSELAGGLYKFAATPAQAIGIVVDGGSTLADYERYKVMQITPNDGSLDAAVSTRAPEAAGNVAAIKADVEHGTYGLNALLMAIGTRMATFTYTAPDSAATIAAAVWGATTRTLSSFGTLVADIATAVWGAGTKVLTSFGTLVADTATAVWGAGTKALTDKAGFSIAGTKTTLDDLHDATQGATTTDLASALSSLLLAIRGADGDTLKTLSDQIDLAALETTLTAIKGTGWTTETLKAIQAAVDGIHPVVNPIQVFSGFNVTVSQQQAVVTVDGSSTAKAIFKVGESKDLVIYVRDKNKHAIDLSDAVLFLGIKASKTDAAYTISKDDAEFDMSQAASGIASVHLDEADTALTPRTYVAELRCSWGSGEDTIIKTSDIIIEIQKAVTT